jgi:sec-independent protein translocase protein TatA
MPFGIGVWELAILLLVALLVFGPKRLPEMGRSLGRGMREFKDSVSGNSRDDDDDDRERDRERERARELPSTRDEETVAASASSSRERDTA